VKKFLFVLCLALLLTLICTSAMAAIDSKYTSKGVELATLSVYNGEYVSDVTLTKEPKCAPGTALITTDMYLDYTPIVDENGNPTTHLYSVSVDALHKLSLKTLDGKAPKCGENGAGKYVCDDCGAVDPNGQGEVAIEALPKDHTFSPDVYKIDEEPTCSKDGKKHQVCIYCGEPKRNPDNSITYITIPKSEHSFKAGAWVVEKPQTCKEGGLRYLICATCGEPQPDPLDPSKIKYDEDYKSPADHTFGDWVIEVAANCKDGLKTRYCSVCNYKESVIIPATGSHKWVYSASVNAPCTATGGVPDKAPEANIVAVKECSICGTKETLDHSSAEFTSRYSDYYDHHKFTVDPNGVTKPAGCVDGPDGSQDMICSVCGGKKTITLPHKTAHNWGEWVLKVKPGTDGTKNGVWERKCTNYHCIEVDTYVGVTAPKGADPVTPVVDPTTAPTSPSGTENYKITSWAFTGSSVSGSVAGNVSYRTPGLSVNVIIYTPTGTFLSVNAPVDEDGHFSVSAGGAVYAVSVQLRDNNKTYQTEGKYV